MTPDKAIEAFKSCRAEVSNSPPIRFPSNEWATDEKFDAIQSHIAWLCEEGVRLVEAGRLEKAMRWLGFVQGALWSWCPITLEELVTIIKGHGCTVGCAEMLQRNAGLIDHVPGICQARGTPPADVNDNPEYLFTPSAAYDGSTVIGRLREWAAGRTARVVPRAADVEITLLRSERDQWKDRARVFERVLKSVGGVLRDLTVGAPVMRAELAADGVETCLEEHSYPIDEHIAARLSELPLTSFGSEAPRLYVRSIRTCKSCRAKTVSTSTCDWCIKCGDLDGLRPKHFLTAGDSE